jgi:uncharacterized membrane-anchored protein
MHMSLGLIELISIAALISGTSVLGFGLWRVIAARRTLGSEPQIAAEITNLIREGEERLTSMVAMMDAGNQANLASLRQELTTVKADVDWLTGEKMIEQAITMAREGIAAEEISADLGLSFDAAHTISVMRRH